MEPQRTTPMEMRRYGYATPPAFGFGGGGVDGGAFLTVGDADEDVDGAGAAAGGAALVPTTGRDLGGSL